MTSTNFFDLPPEIVIKIFQYLEFYDILAARLCCKRWFAFTKLPEFNSKGIFKMISCRLDNNHPAAEVILDRQIKRLYLKNVKFGDVDQLFPHIGISLEELSLLSVPITAVQLTLKHFRNLSFLKVYRIRPPCLVEDTQNLQVIDLSQLKELQLIGNDINVDKYLLSCSLNNSSLERLTLDFKSQNEPEVLIALKTHSHSLKQLDLRLYEGSLERSSQWSEILTTLNLRELSLHGNFRMPVLISAIVAKKLLRLLDLTGSVQVIDDYLNLIVDQLPELEILILAYCGRITDNGAKQLSKLSKLRTLDLTCCNRITSVGVRNIIGQSPKQNLVELHLQDLDLDEATVCFCVNNLPNLRVLNLNGCSKALTNQAIQEIFDCQRKLRQLLVNHCNDLSDAGILGLTTGCSIQFLTSLQRLNLRGCKKLSDVTLICLKSPRLKFLDISHCDTMTIRGLESLVKSCPAIEEMHITHTDAMNDEAIKMLTNGLGRLRLLTVNNCANGAEIGAANFAPLRLRSSSNTVTLKRCTYTKSP